MTDEQREARLKELGMTEIKPGEVLLKALVDEAVFTKEQQENLIKNFSNMANFGMRTGVIASTPSVQPTKQVAKKEMNVNVGEIHVHDVGDVNGFAKAVKTQLGPIMNQEFSAMRW